MKKAGSNMKLNAFLTVILSTYSGLAPFANAGVDGAGGSTGEAAQFTGAPQLAQYPQIVVQTRPLEAYQDELRKYTNQAFQLLEQAAEKGTPFTQPDGQIREISVDDVKKARQALTNSLDHPGTLFTLDSTLSIPGTATQLRIAESSASTGKSTWNATEYERIKNHFVPANGYEKDTADKIMQTYVVHEGLVLANLETTGIYTYSQAFLPMGDILKRKAYSLEEGYRINQTASAAIVRMTSVHFFSEIDELDALNYFTSASFGKKYHTGYFLNGDWVPGLNGLSVMVSQWNDLVKNPLSQKTRQWREENKTQLIELAQQAQALSAANSPLSPQHTDVSAEEVLKGIVDFSERITQSVRSDFRHLVNGI